MCYKVKRESEVNITIKKGDIYYAVLIGLVIIFKKQINTLLESIFKQINSKSKEVY